MVIRQDDDECFEQQSVTCNNEHVAGRTRVTAAEDCFERYVHVVGYDTW